MVPLAGSERTERPGATLIGPVPDDELIEFAAVLRARPDAPDLADVAQAAAVTGEFLSREEVMTAAAPAPADVAAVGAYAQASGLTVGVPDPLTRRVRLSGPAGAVRRAFGVSLNRYAHDGGMFRGRTGPVLIPATLAGVIVGVLGTDNRPMARRQAVPAFFSGGSVQLPVPQLAVYYNYPVSLDGTGQCIGIVELGGGYFVEDIAQYFLDQENTPAITPVPVAGGSNSPTPTPPPLGQPDYTAEVELDIEIAGAAAPGASIVVYFVGDASSNGYVDALSAAIADVANNPSVISISWSAAEDSTQWPMQDITAIDQALATAAAAGLTVLICSGDCGSQGSWGQPVTPPPDSLAHVNFPASSPNATGVGGTILEPALGGGILQETTWNNGPIAASGGGVSDIFPVPLYQTAAGITPRSKNPNPTQNFGRGVPDVSANADGYPVIIRGNSVIQGGTSAATPLWAALIARVNQGLGWPWCGLLQPVLYTIPGAMNDVTIGDNQVDPSVPFYPATKGWDPCTGLGSPNGLAILLGYRRLRQVAPVVTSISESDGNPGDTLTVIGSNFLGATAVGFGTVSAGIGGAPPDDGIVVSDTMVTVTVPAGPASGTTVDVTVTAPGGASFPVTADQFTYD
jgi:kumamolisin